MSLLQSTAPDTPTVPLTRRISMFLGILAAVLPLAVLAGVVGVLYARPAIAQTGGVPGMRQITVVGHGEVMGRPDIATVQIGVETHAATAKEALAQNSTQAQAIVQQLKDLDVAEPDIQTSSFAIFPVYNEDGRQVTGYRVSNNVTVKIRNLDQAGTLLDQMVRVGANSIYSLSFSVEQPEALLEQARRAAMTNARARATHLASAGDVALGEVLVITEQVGAVSPIPLALTRGEQEAPAVPVQLGEQRFSVDVQVTFGLQ
jgi:uncharacterized protein